MKRVLFLDSDGINSCPYLNYFLHFEYRDWGVFTVTSYTMTFFKVTILPR